MGVARVPANERAQPTMTTNLRLPPAALDPSDPWAADRLNRRQLAEFLTRVLVAQSEGCVLNLDGRWGSGKTFFLERWAADLRGSHAVVTFNAWESDGDEDPLASLLAEIKGQLASTLPKKAATKKLLDKLVKKSGPLLVATARIATKAAVRKVSGEEGLDLVSNVLDSESEEDIADSLGNAASKLVRNAVNRRAATKGFRAQFQSLVEHATTVGEMQPPFLIFIDELDRCRPTYALEVLECVKHLFSTPHAVFVIATDARQLHHSVNAVYGAGFDAERYLRRFFDITCRLPLVAPKQLATQLWHSAPLVNDGRAIVPTGTPELLGELAVAFDLTTRDFEQCYLRTRAAAANLPADQSLHWLHLAWLVMAQMQCPTNFGSFVDRSITSNEFLNQVRKAYPALNEGVGYLGGIYLSIAYGDDEAGISNQIDQRQWDSSSQWDMAAVGTLSNLVNESITIDIYLRVVALAGAIVAASR